MGPLEKAWLFLLGLPKTIYFNFSYFPLSAAVRLPVFVSNQVSLRSLGGKIIMPAYKTGTVKIGFGDVGIFDKYRSRTVWQVGGIVEFKGRANIGHGSKISVGGRLTIGDGFCISAESTIVALSEVSIGRDVLISWDALIMDSDFHKIFDSEGRQTNPPKKIEIGDRVWIGCRSLVLKGVKIPHGAIVSAGSTVTKDVDEENAILAGSPAKVIRSNVRWEE